jgi:pyruvate dehydrogenase E2 component (dihydrolipoamide acetyltransferase)
MLESNSVQFFVPKTNGGADMATAVIMPRQGNTVESCVVSKWHKKKGDKVNIGDILFTYETDKATFDEEAKTEGILLETYFEEAMMFHAF